MVDRLIMQSKCVQCGFKKSRFVKLCYILGIKRPLCKIPLLNVLNKIVNKFLVVGDKFMPEMHLKQPGFTDSACGPLTKNKERIESFMQTGRPQTLFIEMNLIEPVFNMIWLIVNQNI